MRVGRQKGQSRRERERLLERKGNWEIKRGALVVHIKHDKARSTVAFQGTKCLAPWPSYVRLSLSPPLERSVLQITEMRGGEGRGLPKSSRMTHAPSLQLIYSLTPTCSLFFFFFCNVHFATAQP